MIFYHGGTDYIDLHRDKLCETLCIPCLRGYLMFVEKTLFKIALFDK